MPFCIRQETTKWLRKHAYERWMWVNEWQPPLFLNLHLPKPAGILLPINSLQQHKERHTSNLPDLPRTTWLHQQTGAGWCRQEEQGDKQLESRVADVFAGTCLRPQTEMIATADTSGSCLVASESTKWNQCGSHSNDTFTAAKWQNMTWKSWARSLTPRNIH